MRRTIFFTTLFICSIFFSQSVLAWNYLNTLNDSSTAKNFTFTTSENVTTWIRLPKQSRVIDAKLNLSGYYNDVSPVTNYSDISLYDYGSPVYNDSEFPSYEGTSAQSFNLTYNLNVTKIKIYIERYPSTGTGFVWLELNTGNDTQPEYNSTIGKPTNSFAISDAINISDYPSFTWVTFNITASLNSSTRYWIMIRGNRTICGVVGGDGSSSTYVNGRGKYFNLNYRCYMSYGADDCTSDPISTDFFFEIYGESYPTNPYLDVSGDGDTEWSYTGEFNESVSPKRTADFSSEINTYLSTCTPDANGNCDVPLILHSDTAGKIQISDINITWGSPKWSNNSTSTPIYDGITKDIFNITWSDDSPYYIDKVFIESNYSGTPTNYTMTRISGDQYSGVYNYNLTLPAGSFYWKSYANASDGVRNSTPKWEFTINKGATSIKLYRNGTEWTSDYTTTYPESTNINATINVSTLSASLLRNGSLVSNPEIIELGAGSYNYTGNFSGNQNYTASSKELNLIINKATPVLTGTVTTPITYETASDYSGSESNNGDSGCSYILLRNGTQIATGSSVSDTTVLGAGAYNYTYYTAGCSNYTSGKDEDILVVNKKSVTITLGGITGQTITYETSVTPYCAASEGSCILYRDGVDKTSTENNTATIYGYKSSPYIFTANGTLDTQNYSYTNQSSTLTVNKKAFTFDFSLANETIVYETTVIEYVTSNDTASASKLTLWRNNVNITDLNGTTEALGVGAWNFVANSTHPLANYSWNPLSSTVTVVKKGISIVLAPSSETITYETTRTQYCAGNHTTYKCTLWRNETNVTSENNTSPTLGAGSYIYKANVTAPLANYSWSEQSSTLTVNKKNANVAVNPSTQSQTYEDTPLYQYCTDDSSLLNCVLYRNDVQISNNTNPRLGAGTYYYKANISDYSNYTSYEATSTLTINPKNANVQVYPVTQTVSYPTTQTQYCTDDSTLIDCLIYRNDASITNNTNYSPAVGVYVYKANITDQTNYTGYTDSETLTVNKGTTETYLYLNGTSSDRTYPQYFEANLTGVVNVSTLTVYLDMNATGWGNNFASGTGSVINISNMSMALGTYNITAHFDGNQNYTSSSKTYYVTITDATTPQYSNLKTSPISPTAYSPGQAYQFNATWTDNAAVDKVIFEWNGANTTVTTYQGSEYYITKNDLPAGTYNYRWYANDTSNNWGSTSLYVYTVNKRPAEVTLYLNGSSATKWYQSGATANFTVYSNVSTTVVLTANITGWTDQEATQTIYNTTALTGGDGTAYNITGYVKDTANYTGTLSDTEYAKMDSSKPTVYSFSVNDSYANMNQTVLLSVNATDGFAGIDTVLAEVQKPSGKANYTLPLSASGNYSRLVNKTDLGDTQNDIGRINITKIYVNDTANNVQANTTSLHFDYAQTNALDWGDSPDPITNAEGQAVTIWANYTDLESTILTGSTCRVTVFGYTWDMSYIDTNKRYEITISTYNRTPDTYAYNISCANSSYQTQQCTNSSQTVEVKEVVTGGPVGGGGGGEAPPPLANFTMTPETWNVIISPNRTFERSFHICNKDTRTIKIKFEPTGEYSQWVSMVRYKEEKFLYQAIPAYGVPGGIDFLILEPGICDDISVEVAVPEVPDSPPAYEIGLKAVDVSTSSTQVSKLVISVQRGVGAIRELGDKIYNVLLFGIKIGPEYKKISVCHESRPNVCVPGSFPLYVPFLVGIVPLIIVSYLVWRFVRRKFVRFGWVFVLATIIIYFVVLNSIIG